jgi:hypothetical protein
MRLGTLGGVRSNASRTYRGISEELVNANPYISTQPPSEVTR